MLSKQFEVGRFKEKISRSLAFVIRRRTEKKFVIGIEKFKFSSKKNIASHTKMNKNGTKGEIV